MRRHCDKLKWVLRCPRRLMSLNHPPALCDRARLGGIVASVKEGRTTFQRILTYTLRSIVHKVVQVLFLAAGLIITGQAILTPMLMVLMMGHRRLSPPCRHRPTMFDHHRNQVSGGSTN